MTRKFKYTFSISGILILTAGVAIVCFLVRLRALHVQAIRELESKGHKITKLDDGGYRLKLVADCDVNDFSSLRHVWDVREVFYECQTIDDPILNKLTENKTIRRFELECKPTDECDVFVYLARLNRLEILKLTLVGHSVDGGIAQLCQLTDLETLDMSSNIIETDGVAGLGELDYIKELDLSHCFGATEDDTLQSIASMDRLEILILQDSGMVENGSGFRHFPVSAPLRELNLDYQLDLNDEALLYIGRITALEGLSLMGSGSSVTSEGLAHLADLPNLHELRLSGVDDEELLSVGRLSRLRSLYIKTTSISPAGLECLKELGNLERLVFLGVNDVDDEHVLALSKLTQLKELKLGQTNVSNSGKKQLNEALINLTTTVN